jgi:uncharacterized protein YndB with AHSA1/START domain
MPAIRRHIHIATTPRRVWRALTTAEGLKEWLVDDARVDARKGGRIILTFEGDDGEPVEAVGFIHKWRPTSQLEISWDNVGKYEGRGSNLAFQVAMDGDEARLSLVMSGGDAMADEERFAALNKEWRRDLAALQGLLDDKS